MKKSIEILCAVTCTYENKKLSIVCPLGKVIDSLDNFNAEYLAKRFSADINKAYPLESLVEAEQMLAPIVNRFGRIPDRSYATIAGIRNSETGEDMPNLKRKIDELYTIEKDLESAGYNAYGVFYVENNIEKFTDENDIPFSEDRNLIKVSRENYDLEQLINFVRGSYTNTISSSSIPSLFNECFIYSEYYNGLDKDKVLNIQDINNFFKNVEEGSLYLPFAIKNSNGKLDLATREHIEINSINTGEIDFKVNNQYGISIDLIDDEYIFNQVEYILNKNSSISILEYCESLTNKLVDFISQFKK